MVLGSSHQRLNVNHRPKGPPGCAYDLAATGVEHDGEIEETGCGRHEGDIGDAKLVGSFGGEFAIDQARCWPGILVTSRRRRATAAMTGAR